MKGEGGREALSEQVEGVGELKQRQCLRDEGIDHSHQGAQLGRG